MAGHFLGIGLNRVDPHAYGGWSGVLQGCINDVTDVARLAYGRGYKKQTILTDSDATWENCIEARLRIGHNMNDSDKFAEWGSHHGSKEKNQLIPDKEIYGTDYAACYYNGIVLDDVLHMLYAQFPKGSSCFAGNDSCLSGTFHRSETGRREWDDGFIPHERTVRAAPRWATTYTKKVTPEYMVEAFKLKDTPLKAYWRFMAMCTETQFSNDMQKNGWGTLCFLNIMKRHKDITYPALYEEMLIEMKYFDGVKEESEQTPVYTPYVKGAPLSVRKEKVLFVE